MVTTGVATHTMTRKFAKNLCIFPLQLGSSLFGTRFFKSPIVVGSNNNFIAEYEQELLFILARW